MTKVARGRAVRVAAVAAVAAMLVTAWQTGLLAQFSDLARARATLLSYGAWGYVGFVVAYMLLQPFGVPGTVFVMVAPLVWPWPVAFALSMVGTMAASVVGFSFARFVARDALASRIPERFKKYDRALEEHGFATVALLRFVFWMPQLLHTFLGLSRVSFAAHFWGSLVGYAVPLFLVSFFGQRLFDWMRGLSATTWGVTGAVVLAVGGGVWWWRRPHPPRPLSLSGEGESETDSSGIDSPSPDRERGRGG